MTGMGTTIFAEMSAWGALPGRGWGDMAHWAKLDFYAAHEVDEVLIADPEAQQVTWPGRDGTGYSEAAGSGLLGIATEELAAGIDWPPVA
jgi:hypothetical protein